MRGPAIRVAVVVAAVVVWTVPARSQRTGMDAKARTALESMSAAYKALDAFHIKVRWTARYTGAMSADDFPVPGPDVLELRMQRPNKFFMAASGKRLGKASSYLIVSDGTSLWHWRSQWKDGTNAYTQTRAPATIPELAKLLPDDAIGTFSPDGNSWDVDTIMEWDHLVSEIDPVKDFPEGLVVTLGAPEKIGSAPVDVIRTITTDEAVKMMGVATEINLYLSTASHLIRGYKLAVKGKNEETGKSFSVGMDAVYEVHDTHPRFGAADFTFVPPPGAKKMGARSPRR